MQFYFSGYLTSFSSVAGAYSWVVRASDAAGRARVPSQSPGTGADCCGSGFPVSSTIPTPSFTRLVTAASFYMTEGVQFFIRNGMPKSQDLFPPSRVTDLRVKTYDDADGRLDVVVAWTAPGGDFNIGSALRYRIVGVKDKNTPLPTAAPRQSSGNISAAASVIDVRKGGGGATFEVPIGEVPRPRPAGTLQECRVTLPAPNQIFHLSILALDEAGNVSPASNLVPVFIRRLILLAPADPLAAAAAASDGKNTSAAVMPSSVLQVEFNYLKMMNINQM